MSHLLGEIREFLLLKIMQQFGGLLSMLSLSYNSPEGSTLPAMQPSSSHAFKQHVLLRFSTRHDVTVLCRLQFWQLAAAVSVLLLGALASLRREA